MLFAQLQGCNRFRNTFVSSGLGLKVEEIVVHCVEGEKHVLGTRDELFGLHVDRGQQLECFHMEWEVLDASGQSDGAYKHVDQRLNQQFQFAFVGHEADPDFNAVVKLPAVNTFYGLLSKVVSDGAQVQAQLPDVHLTKLEGKRLVGF